MTTFIIQEMQTANDHREGYEVEAKTLNAAKRIATSNKAFYGTILKISAKASGECLSIKEDGKWQDAE